MRFGTYNIHHGADASGRVSPRRIAETLRRLKLDAVGLQEVRRVLHREGQATAIARPLGMASAYGRASLQGAFSQGNAVLTPGRIIKRRILPLPFVRERRTCLITELEIDGVRLCVAVTHLTLDQPTRARAIQLLAKELPRDLPLVLLGDMNATVSELDPLREWLVVPDEPPQAYPAASPQHAIDHIVFSRHWRLESLEAVPSDASDHLPVVAELTLR